jgi:DNA-binding ferritin-like protein
VSGAWARLVHWDYTDPEFLALCNEALQEIQRDHAHKLAEKIREDDTRACAPASQAYFANLIDPEAQR